jgi:beta-N-acetylhexosaminidase
VTDRAILGRVMLAFVGETLPGWVAARLAEAPAAGMTMFLHHNVRSPGQLRELTEAFQHAGAVSDGAPPASGRAAPAPMLVAADQEGGQLLALGDGPTAFAGNMALGAVADADLAERVGEAIGREARAMGVNVVYAPVMDVATNPANPALGIRSFGDDAAEVGRLGAAMVRGLQRAGVASGIKHFPGLGEAAVDTHHGVAAVGESRERMETVELAPFRAGIEAGARLVMSAHVAAPALAGGSMLPSTLSRAVMTDVLRTELGFEGVSISDALDMGALAQGPGQAVDVIAAARAGVDLFLCAADPEARRRIEDTLVAAAERAVLDPGDVAASLDRVSAVRRWLGSAGPAPDLAVVGSVEHRALSRELAERSMTLVRDETGLVPLRLPADATILAVMPTPTDLTPADTSSVVAPGLARAVREWHGRVEELVVPIAPADADISAAVARARDVGLVVVGTIDAVRHPGQAALVEALAATGTPTIAVALRTPWDVATYPPRVTAVCTYSILPDSLDALAGALFEVIPFAGRLPVEVRHMATR